MVSVVYGKGITYTGTAASYRYEYDACDRLSKLTCGTGSDTWETVYTYDNDGKAKTVTLQNGKVLPNTYDSLGSGSTVVEYSYTRWANTC